MDAQTQDPSTGTKLRIDSDREFTQSGEAVWAVHGESPDGQAVLDTTMVEVQADDAEFIGEMLRNLRRPPQETIDAMAQQVQATFGSKLDGRDAKQIAELCARTTYEKALVTWGGSQNTDATTRLDNLAERFGRAAGKARKPAGFQSHPAGSRN